MTVLEIGIVVTFEGRVSGRGQERAFWLQVIFCFLIWVLVTTHSCVSLVTSGPLLFLESQGWK